MPHYMRSSDVSFKRVSLKTEIQTEALRDKLYPPNLFPPRGFCYIYFMATAKQNSRRGGELLRRPARKTAASKNQSLQKLYARLEKTQPGSEESKRISKEIVDAIG